jgi:hypothetical protein
MTGAYFTLSKERQFLGSQEAGLTPFLPERGEGLVDDAPVA